MFLYKVLINKTKTASLWTFYVFKTCQKSSLPPKKSLVFCFKQVATSRDVMEAYAEISKAAVHQVSTWCSAAEI